MHEWSSKQVNAPWSEQARPVAVGTTVAKSRRVDPNHECKWLSSCLCTCSIPAFDWESMGPIALPVT